MLRFARKPGLPRSLWVSVYARDPQEQHRWCTRVKLNHLRIITPWSGMSGRFSWIPLKLANQDYCAKMGEFRIAYPNDGTWAAGPFQVGHKLFTSMPSYAILCISPRCLLIPHSPSNHFPFLPESIPQMRIWALICLTIALWRPNTTYMASLRLHAICPAILDPLSHLWMLHNDIFTGGLVCLSTLDSLSKTTCLLALIEQRDSNTSHPAPIQSDTHLGQCAKAWCHMCLWKIPEKTKPIEFVRIICPFLIKFLICFHKFDLNKG